MSKKKIILIVIVILILILILMITAMVGYKIYRKIFPDYTGWKKIEITDIGSFYVPEDWIYTKDGTIVYFTDKPITEENYNIYLIGTEFIKNEKYIKITDIYPEYNEIRDEKHKLLSNSADYEETIFEINNKEERKFHIEFFGGNYELDLYAWDNLVDINTIKKIAESYISES